MSVSVRGGPDGGGPVPVAGAGRTRPPRVPGGPEEPWPDREVALVDLLDRVLGTGVVITGDLTISIAGVDLVRISLRALVSTVGKDVPSPWEHGHPLRPASGAHRSRTTGGGP